MPRDWTFEVLGPEAPTEAVTGNLMSIADDVLYHQDREQQMIDSIKLYLPVMRDCLVFLLANGRQRFRLRQ